ncbi:MAG: hypothetical protein EOL97_00025 [Spirochaetia bacterium]|nr:hypothetical protein [Spirochaetia bacterium]
MEKSIKEKLEKLTRDKLNNIIVDYYDINEDFRKFIDNSFLEKDDNYNRLLSTIKEIDSETKYTINATLESFFIDIELFIKSPKDAIFLLFQFFNSEEIITEIIDQTDSYHDEDYEYYLYDAISLFKKALKECEDKDYVIEKLIEFFEIGGISYNYSITSNINNILSASQIRLLISKLLCDIEKQEYKDYCLIVDLAKEIHDGELYEKYSSYKINSSISYLDIAKVYFNEKKYDVALEKAKLFNPSYIHQENEKNELLNRIYEKLGNGEEVYNTAKELFDKSATVENLDLLMKSTINESRDDLINKKIESFYNGGNVNSYKENIRFLLDVDRVDAAEKYFFKNIDKIEDLREYYIHDIIDDFKNNNKYLVATLLYRDLLLEILNNANYKAYKYGASYLLELSFLSNNIDDWKDIMNHEEFLTEIRLKHSRKKSFWGLCGLI